MSLLLLSFFLPRRRGLVALLLAAALGLAATGPAWAVATAKAAPVTLNFADTDVAAVTRAMSALLGRPITVDPRVKGTLTLYTDEPVTLAQAQALYVAALRGLGYAMVENAGLLKVVPEAEAKLQAGSAGTGPRPAGGADPVVTQVFPVVHENATNLVAVLRPLISPNNLINANAGNNTLVITDYASNLARLATLIAALDTPSATDVEVIALQHTQASTMAATVQKLLDSSGSAAGAPSTGAAAPAATGGAVVLADPNLNALLVRAPNPARLAIVRALVARLDQPSSGGPGNVHVVYLKNAEATRLATVLRAAFPGLVDSSRSGGGIAGSSLQASVATSAAGISGTGTGNSASSSTGTSAAATAPVNATAQPSTGGAIQADPASNALIVTAPEPMFRDLRAVIDQLDNPRAQLYVESLVVEVDASKTRDVGVKWQQIFNISSSSLSTLTLGDVAEALETQAGSNILSTANVMTLDNEEAKIVVGQNVPFVTGNYTTSAGTTSNPFQTIERKDVGITLRIRPQIGENGSIRMTIFQESSSVASTSSSGPTTNKRSIETTVTVHDGKIIVLGGLIEDSYSADNSDVPGLSRVPALGALFRSRSRSRKKTNLVVFLRPYVMRDETATGQLSVDRYDLIRARQRALPEDPRDALTGAPMPSLP